MESPQKHRFNNHLKLNEIAPYHIGVTVAMVVAVLRSWPTSLQPAGTFYNV